MNEDDELKELENRAMATIFVFIAIILIVSALATWIFK